MKIKYKGFEYIINVYNNILHVMKDCSSTINNDEIKNVLLSNIKDSITYETDITEIEKEIQENEIKLKEIRTRKRYLILAKKIIEVQNHCGAWKISSDAPF